MSDQALAALIAEGQFERAERFCLASADRGEATLQCLRFLSRQALNRSDYEDARSWGQRAADVAPADVGAQMDIGFAGLGLQHYEEAADAFIAASALDDRVGLALLLAAQCLDRLGRRRAAALAYGLALLRQPTLTEAYRDPTASPQVRELSHQANICVREYRMALYEASIQQLELAFGGQSIKRLRQFTRVIHGLERVVSDNAMQRPSYCYFPGLSARPWYEPSEFPWAEHLAASSEDILTEYRAIGGSDSQQLDPYVSASEEAQDWSHLAGKLAWSSYHLLKGGEKVSEHCQACPRTLKAVTELPLAQATGHAPEAFFSVLQPGAHIPPHFGLSNAKLAVHLPLVVNDECALRVGDEARIWRAGEVLIFDDSFEHEAWNRGDRTRVVLITEVWNPELTDVERAGVGMIMAAADDWNRQLQELLPRDLLSDAA